LELSIEHQIKPRNQTRNQRTLAKLRGMAAVTTAAAPIQKIQNLAEALGVEMRKAHGGTWSIDIDHDDCFVLISRDFPV
jgi:hypothetical protein